MSILRRLDRMDRELNHYMRTEGKRKQVFAVMEQMNEIGLIPATQEDSDRKWELFKKFLKLSAGWEIIE